MELASWRSALGIKRATREDIASPHKRDSTEKMWKEKGLYVPNTSSSQIALGFYTESICCRLNVLFRNASACKHRVCCMSTLTGLSGSLPLMRVNRSICLAFLVRTYLPNDHTFWQSYIVQSPKLQIADMCSVAQFISALQKLPRQEEEINIVLKQNKVGHPNTAPASGSLTWNRSYDHYYRRGKWLKIVVEFNM